MAANGISGEVHQFIFDYIDSVEQLDVLLLLRDHPSRVWTVHDVTESLRTNAVSVANRLNSLKGLDLVEEIESDPVAYRYLPKTAKAAKVVDELNEANKIRRHRLLELIFSPAKRARDFADAFIVRGTGKGEDTDG